MPAIGAYTVNSLATGASGRPLWPSDLPGLVLWLPADQIQGIATGTLLSTWTDSSASASHATQPSASSQPSLLVGAKNGLSAVSFGIASVMQSATSGSDACAYLVVMAPQNALSNDKRIIGTGQVHTTLNGGTIGNYRTFRSASQLTIPSSGTGVWVSLFAQGDANGSNGTLTVNGVSQRTDQFTASGVTGVTTSIGGATNSTGTCPGLYGEVLVYNRNITESERSSLDSYLRQKWGI